MVLRVSDRDEFLREDEGEDGSLNATFKGLSRKQKAELLKVRGFCVARAFPTK